MITVTETATKKPPEAAKKKQWAPRMWLGCSLSAWIRLLYVNRFAVGFWYWYIAVIDTFFALWNSAMQWIEYLIFGWAVHRTKIKEAPIFIIGHWRTGTTLLHELLILDKRYGYPNTYQCMSPTHFLISEWLLTRIFGFIMPTTRPMDNVKVGFDRPQEDEFALCMLGQPSPYLTIAFPNNPLQGDEYLGMETLTRRQRESWKRTFLWLLRRLTFKIGKRLVLKSPPHTARIDLLQEMFPEAIFIHIVRDPFVVYPSTVKLWKSLYETHGLQKPNFSGLEDYVFSTGNKLYERLEQTRNLVDDRRYYELKYEDLVADPVNEIRKLYHHLNLGNFSGVESELLAYTQSNANYKPNKYKMNDEEMQKVSNKWGKIIQRYGYDQK